LSSPLNSRSEFIQKDANSSSDPLLTPEENSKNIRYFFYIKNKLSNNFIFKSKVAMVKEKQKEDVLLIIIFINILSKNSN
jgi:hypothetical protein